MSAQPPAGPPPGPSIGPPGGVFGPPGGLPPRMPPPPSAFVPPMAVALPLGGVPVGAMPGTAPAMGGPPGGAVAPGGAPPLGLPDLQAVGRAAMADVLEGTAAQTAARERLPDLVEQADQARIAAQASGALPAGAVAHAPEVAVSATAPAGVRYLPPGQTGPVPGVWRAPPPAWSQPGWQPQARPPAHVLPGERDTAQRIGDRLYPLVERIRDSRAGWMGVIALFGITVPIILLRQRFDVRGRLVLAFFAAIFWLQLLSELFGD